MVDQATDVDRDVQVGFIGLGGQGAPMARRILMAGYPLTVWARRQEVVDEFVELGAHPSDDVATLGGRCQHVGLCVVNDSDVLEVCESLIPAIRPGSRLAIHSTILPETIGELHRRCAQAGIGLIDAPVSGGSPAADAGTLTVMCGADENDFEQARRVFESFGGLIVLLGEPGAGQRAKIVNNALMAANMGMAHAATQVADALGIERWAFSELVMASSERSYGFEMYATLTSPAAFVVGAPLLQKDLGLLKSVVPDAWGADVLGAGAAHFLDEASG